MIREPGATTGKPTLKWYRIISGLGSQPRLVTSSWISTTGSPMWNTRPTRELQVWSVHGGFAHLPRNHDLPT